MNEQARSGRYYYAEEFEGERRIPWSLIVTLLFAAAMTHMGAIAFGMAISDRSHRAELERLTAMPKRIEPARGTAFTQWSCSKDEVSEYRRTCAQRLRAELTNPKER